MPNWSSKTDVFLHPGVYLECVMVERGDEKHQIQILYNSYNSYFPLQNNIIIYSPINKIHVFDINITFN